MLKNFLPSIILFSEENPIYLIDNGSKDNSISFTRKYFSNIKIIKNNKNLGFSKGYNIGLKTIKEELICLINSDVRVTKDWLKPIINLYKKYNIYVIQPKIKDEKKNNILNMQERLEEE